MAVPEFPVLLRRWHRHVGVAAVVLLVMALFGVLLAPPALRPSGSPAGRLQGQDGVPAVDSGPMLAGKVLHVTDGQLRMGAAQLADCPRLVGVMQKRGQVVVVCSDRLVVLSPEGRLIDQVDSLRGIPSGLSAWSEQGDTLLLKTTDSSLGVNLSDLSVHPATTGPEVQWRSAITPAAGGVSP